MAKQTINLGTGELTGDGESIRNAFGKINNNFDEVYNSIASISTFGGDYNSLSNTPDLSQFVSRTEFDTGTVTVDVNNTGDLKGSVFADDSTLLVDGVNGTIPYSVISNVEVTESQLSVDWAGVFAVTIQANGLPSNTRFTQNGPVSSIGIDGDTAGSVTFDSNYAYYCTADYDGVTDIWKRVAWSGDTW